MKIFRSRRITRRSLIAGFDAIKTAIQPVRRDTPKHILPDLDDGADGWGASLEMAQIAAMDGISGIVCTPRCSPVYPGNHRTVILTAV